MMSKILDSHLIDPILQPFRGAQFTPSAYLNSHLQDNLPRDSTLSDLTSPRQSNVHLTTKCNPSSPSHTNARVNSGSPGKSTWKSNSSSIASTASHIQMHISVLAAQQTQLTTTLTELTDDILRTSARLAYEVELLRGDALGLVDSLDQGGPLATAIAEFVPTPLYEKGDAKLIEEQREAAPELAQLEQLHVIRSRLMEVVQVFNSALSFSLPPSVLQAANSSFISIQAPNEDPKAEERGLAAMQHIREEFDEVLRSDDSSLLRNKVQEYRDLSQVWTGTNEEKARNRFVDGLQELFDQAEARKSTSPQKSTMSHKPGKVPAGSGLPVSNSGGFLRRLRDEIYLD